MNLAAEAKQFLRSTRSGVLSSFSAKFAGYPFGSVMPFMLDHNCQPIVLISSIAEHTKNIIANPKVSLMVFNANNIKNAEDLHANGRLTLIGEATQINKNDADLVARYCRYMPESVGYLAMHDFNFYRINIHQARYIAGFGKMGWLAGKELACEEIIDLKNAEKSLTIAQLETSMIEHMNADHADSLLAYCHHFYNMQPQIASLIGVDCDGFDVEAIVDDNISMLRFTFETPIFDANSARMAFVELSKAARA